MIRFFLSHLFFFTPTFGIFFDFIFPSFLPHFFFTFFSTVLITILYPTFCNFFCFFTPTFFFRLFYVSFFNPNFLFIRTVFRVNPCWLNFWFFGRCWLRINTSHIYSFINAIIMMQYYHDHNKPDNHFVGTNPWPSSVEGWVEHEKFNQTTTTLWPCDWDFGVQLDSLVKKFITPL